MKEFNKDDLKTGMLVTLRNGTRCIVVRSSDSVIVDMLKEIEQIGLVAGEYHLSNYNDNLERVNAKIGCNTSMHDVVKVESITGRLLWDRKGKKKYTYEQIKEILGEEFEIVKE